MPRTFSPKIIKAKLDLQYGRCANNRFYKGIGLNGYECPMWKCNEGKFDEAGCQADHIIEYAKGGDVNIENCQLLCPSCHAVKTKRFMEDKSMNSLERHNDYTPMTDKDTTIKKKRKLNYLL